MQLGRCESGAGIPFCIQITSKCFASPWVGAAGDSKKNLAKLPEQCVTVGNIMDGNTCAAQRTAGWIRDRSVEALLVGMVDCEALDLFEFQRLSKLIATVRKATPAIKEDQ